MKLQPTGVIHQTLRSMPPRTEMLNAARSEAARQIRCQSLQMGAYWGVWLKETQQSRGSLSKHWEDFIRNYSSLYYVAYNGSFCFHRFGFLIFQDLTFGSLCGSRDLCFLLVVPSNSFYILTYFCKDFLPQLSGVRRHFTTITVEQYI